MNKKRDIAGEIMEGIEAMRKHREGKITLRTFVVESMPRPEIDAQIIRETREYLNLSSSNDLTITQIVVMVHPVKFPKGALFNRVNEAIIKRYMP